MDVIRDIVQLAASIESTYAYTIDDELIALAKSGDDEACLEIRNRYHNRLYQTALAMLSSPEKARHAVEHIWQMAWKELHEFQGQSLFLTWICRRLIAYIIKNFLQTGQDDSPDRH